MRAVRKFPQPVDGLSNPGDEGIELQPFHDPKTLAIARCFRVGNTRDSRRFAESGSIVVLKIEWRHARRESTLLNTCVLPTTREFHSVIEPSNEGAAPPNACTISKYTCSWFTFASVPPNRGVRNHRLARLPVPVQHNVKTSFATRLSETSCAEDLYSSSDEYKGFIVEDSAMRKCTFRDCGATWHTPEST